MKKILFLLFLVLFSVSAFALPSDLELNCTFSYFKVSTDEVNWENIIATPTTVNLLAITDESGTAVTITPPTVGETYRYLGMGVTALYFEQNGQTRDILPVLKAQSGGGEDWDNISMPIIPFTSSGTGDLGFNMYFPASNISGTTFADYFPVDGPIFTFSGGTAASVAGTYNISIASEVDTNATVYVGAFQNIAQEAAPMFNGVLTNAGDGSASGTMYVPAGDWYLMAVGVDGTVGVDGPQEGSKSYTIGGALPWEEGLSPTTVASGATADVDLEYAFTITSTMGAGGGGTSPTGGAMITFEIAPAAPITLASDTELMLYAYDSAAAYEAGGAPNLFLGVRTVDAGSFSSGVDMTSSGLGAGTYVVTALLSVSGNMPPESGIDYIGLYGGLVGSPSLITLEADTALDLTSNPISLVVMP